MPCQDSRRDRTRLRGPPRRERRTSSVFCLRSRASASVAVDTRGSSVPRAAWPVGRVASQVSPDFASPGPRGGHLRQVDLTGPPAARRVGPPARARAKSLPAGAASAAAACRPIASGVLARIAACTRPSGGARPGDRQRRPAARTPSAADDAAGQPMAHHPATTKLAQRRQRESTRSTRRAGRQRPKNPGATGVAMRRDPGPAAPPPTRIAPVQPGVQASAAAATRFPIDQPGPGRQ